MEVKVVDLLAEFAREAQAVFSDLASDVEEGDYKTCLYQNMSIALDDLEKGLEKIKIGL